MVPAIEAPIPPGGLHGTRQCSRPGCAELATATLTYQYERGSVWVDLLTPEREPHAYDLCGAHAARVSVPRGWRIEDRRSLTVVPAALPGLPPAPEVQASALAEVAPLPDRLAG
jgi:hypothetical protein